MATSFQKKSKGKGLQIAGAKPSLYNNQLLVSSGIPSLDHLLGGGLAVGTVLLIEEDVFGNYSRLMLKYFCAEAVMTGHSLLLASADVSPDQLLSDLPKPIIDDPVDADEQMKAKDSDEHMKIAWRYKHLPKFQSSPTTVKFGHYYDLSKTMEEDLLNTINAEKINICMNTADNLSMATNASNYMALIERIQNKIETENLGTSSNPEKRNILRIALHSLGSPLWGENGGLLHNGDYDPSLCRFLLALRAILRSAFAICVLTVPTHLMCDQAFVNRIERLCDTVVHVDSFAGSDKEKNPAFKEYHGLFNIKKLPSLNTLVCHMPDSLDLAFKLRRKKFTIEKLHLPPELSDTASRSQEDPDKRFKPESGCGSGGNSKLDF